MKSSSYSNSISYVLFTVVPIVLFTIVLILKLRGNYGIHVKHIKESLNECRISKKAQDQSLNATTMKQKELRDSKVKCERRLQGFEDSWNIVASTLFLKDSLNQTQNTEEFQLITSIQRLKDTLTNVTKERDFLKNELQRLSREISNLQSNTSKLQGEKEGLEKVLEVKTVLEDSHRLKEAAASVLETNKMVQTKNVIRELVNDTIHELVESSNETRERENVKRDSSSSMRIDQEKKLNSIKSKGLQNKQKSTSKSEEAEMSITTISSFEK